MKIHHAGWNETVGAFNCDATINVDKCDYEIHFTNGSVFRQETPFDDLVTEFDQNDTAHPRFGAFFSHNGATEFFTPLELVALVANGYATIPGIQLEHKQSPLIDRIEDAVQRAKNLSTPQDKAIEQASPVLS